MIIELRGIMLDTLLALAKVTDNGIIKKCSLEDDELYDVTLIEGVSIEVLNNSDSEGILITAENSKIFIERKNFVELIIC